MSLRDRNFSVDRHFERLAANHAPSHRFAGGDRDAWQRWRDALHPEALATLGALPERVPPQTEVEASWSSDGLDKYKLCFDVEPGLSVPAYLFLPSNVQGPLPGLLACHGHGPLGKEAVMGVATTDEARKTIDTFRYDYGLRMARAGYAVIAIDFRGFGERDDRGKPHYHDVVKGRDICNVHFLRASALGMTVLGMNVHDARAALDVLAASPFVDAERLGVMGLSFGGTMATWMAIADERVKAADVMCYSDRFADFGYRDVNFCGSQITPGLFQLCDVPDLQGLIAPRPLLVEIGTHDSCFRVESALSCYREVERIYEAAGAAERLELDLFEGGHRWGGNRTEAFFARHLAGRSA